MQRLLKVFAIGGLTTLLAGCAERVVVIDRQNDVVRIGPGVTGPGYIWDEKAKTWVKKKKIHYPEGWYAGPGPE